MQIRETTGIQSEWLVDAGSGRVTKVTGAIVIAILNCVVTCTRNKLTLFDWVT